MMNGPAILAWVEDGGSSTVGSVGPERPGRIDTRGSLRWNPGCSQAHSRER
jgi:hypothetical protein